MNIKREPPLSARPEHWEIVQKILKKHVPDYEVWAFGSRAHNTNKPYSDLDLAIITDFPLTIEQSAALEEAFCESDLPWKVDIVDWSTASPAFRQIIQQEKVVVQQAKPNPKQMR